MRLLQATVSIASRGPAPNRWDLAAAPLILGLLALLATGLHELGGPLAAVARPLSLDPSALPEYALRTTLRMLAAMAASLVFTFLYATLAAKSRRAAPVLISILDILQSVPVLGFLSFTVLFFLSLFPGRVLGAELAAVFAVFTSQAWNMAFSFYQSLRTVPRDLDEATRGFRLSAWQRFWRLEVPFAMPGLVWNMMMSMSGGWFFVVAVEAISVGNRTITLPGIGSYVALAIERHDLSAIGWAVAAMLLVILAYDQLLFRPLVAWAARFRVEQTGAQTVPRSWVRRLLRRTRLIRALARPIGRLAQGLARLRLSLPVPAASTRLAPPARLIDAIWYGAIAVAGAYGLWLAVRFVGAGVPTSELPTVLGLGLLTMIRVVVLMALATLVWVPVGVWTGLNPRLAQAVQPAAQFLAAFPANLLFPVFVVAIAHFRLDADIWLSPLMILGSQWYILFNVIAGASAFPTDLREAAATYKLHGRLWWARIILPGVFPYYVTGAITASGGAWNASIVAEMASWGDTRFVAHGLGAYIAEATAAGDYPRIVLGIAVMSLFVVLFNRLLWRRLYRFAERRLRFD
ncbi:MAG TPA: ABC transporter permease subunit [Dongiaceae bacterium]|nr:ABC transporter permease subunit [Dongiaceae bacterium]